MHNKNLILFFCSFIFGCNLSIAQKNQAKYKSAQMKNIFYVMVYASFMFQGCDYKAITFSTSNLIARDYRDRRAVIWEEFSHTMKNKMTSGYEITMGDAFDKHSLINIYGSKVEKLKKDIELENGNLFLDKTFCEDFNFSVKKIEAAYQDSLVTLLIGDKLNTFIREERYDICERCGGDNYVDKRDLERPEGAWKKLGVNYNPGDCSLCE